MRCSRRGCAQTKDLLIHARVKRKGGRYYTRYYCRTCQRDRMNTYNKHKAWEKEKVGVKLRVYTQENCGPCRTAKFIFEKKGIAYEEVDLLPHRQKIHENGFPPVSPTFEYNGKLTQKLTTALKWVS